MKTQATTDADQPAARNRTDALPGSPRDGSGDRDGSCQAIVAGRDSYGQVLWLFGDSIFRGWSLKIFPDAMSDADIAAQPLYPLRSPASMINLILADQGAVELDGGGVAITGQYVACYAGLAGPPGDMSLATSRIERLFTEGSIRPGDVLTFLDAGLHTNDPDIYEAQWLRVRRCAACDGVRLVMCTAFDDLAADPRKVIGDDPSESFMYEVPFRGAASGILRTHNDAVRAAAAVEGLPGETDLVDMARIIQEFEVEIRRDFDVKIYHRGGIHPNVWGQLRLAAELFRSAWPDLPMCASARLESLAADNWGRLGYKTQSPGWSPKAAAKLMSRCLGLA